MATSPDLGRYYHTYGRLEGEDDFPNSLISGISTFLGAQVIPPVKEDLQEAGVKAAVLGLPWEHTNTCRPGASYGPRRSGAPPSTTSPTTASSRSICSTSST